MHVLDTCAFIWLCAEPEKLSSSAAAIIDDNAEQIAISDAPPHGLLSDAGVLAGHVGSVVLICWTGKTRRHAMRQAARHFEDLGTHVLGVIVNAVRFGRNGYFSTYDYYHHGYYQPKYHAAKKTMRRVRQ